MALLGVRLAPGVRVSISARGVRAHVGPRVARVHAGGGRTGISTGAGPLTYYTSVGRSARPRPRSSAQPRPLTSTQQEKAALAESLAHEIADLETRHSQVSFPVMTRPLADLPEPQPGQTLQQHAKRARAGVPWYDVVGRRRARGEAEGRARADDEAAVQQWHLESRNRQEELDAFWTRLLGNDPSTVMAFVQEAFEDNDDPAAILGVESDEAYLAVLAPSTQVVPDRMPGVTPTGLPSIRRMPAKEAAVLHRQAVAGALLVTAMETFAVGPGLGSVKIAALERGEDVTFLWSVRVRRQRLDRCLQRGETSLQILECAADENDYRLVGGARRLGPLDPGDIGWAELQRALLSERKDKR